MKVKLQQLVNREVERGGVPSIVVAVQSEARALDLVVAAGAAEPASGVPMRTDTPIFMASVSKMFTAALVMQLVGERRLELETPLARLLPEAMTRGLHVLHGHDYGSRLCISHLLGHTSGLPDHETEAPRGKRSVLNQLKAGHDRAVSTEEALGIVRALPPHFAPGTPGKAHYSNTNYRLLGAVIEELTGQEMAKNYAERICARLGLEATHLFGSSCSPPQTSVAQLFVGRRPVSVPKYLASNTSDGGVVSTASECMVFLRAFFEGRLFQPTLLPRMTEYNRIFFPLRYGLGLMCFRLPRAFWFRPLPEFVGHSGSTGAFAFLNPASRTYMVGTLNQISPAKPFFLMMKLMRALG